MFWKPILIKTKKAAFLSIPLPTLLAVIRNSLDRPKIAAKKLIWKRKEREIKQ